LPDEVGCAAVDGLTGEVVVLATVCEEGVEAEVAGEAPMVVTFVASPRSRREFP